MEYIYIYIYTYMYVCVHNIYTLKCHPTEVLFSVACLYEVINARPSQYHPNSHPFTSLTLGRTLLAPKKRIKRIYFVLCQPQIIVRIISKALPFQKQMNNINESRAQDITIHPLLKRSLDSIQIDYYPADYIKQNVLRVHWCLLNLFYSLNIARFVYTFQNRYSTSFRRNECWRQVHELSFCRINPNMMYIYAYFFWYFSKKLINTKNTK